MQAFKMKTKINKKLREGLKEIPKYPYNSMPSYFRPILNPPEVDGLFMVHPNYDGDFKKIEKTLIEEDHPAMAKA